MPGPPRPFVAEQVFTQIPLANALDMVAVPGLGQWLIAENGGKILAVADDTATAEVDVAVDLKAVHPACDHVYGIAFHPRFAENRQVFITYTNGNQLEDGSRLSRFRVVREKPLAIDPASEEIVLTWPSGGHNGAAITFGDDGMLYLSTGDAEVPAPPDPRVTGQDLGDFLSCILRIDVDRREEGRGYAVPKDNPFVATPGARPEIWAYGLRNPWKMSFDRKTGNLWCGDVGWEQWEMIHLITRSGNYGWSCMEGINSLFPARKGPTPISPPVVTHGHDEAASITGGFVYRGKRLPELAGAYIYGDYETGKVWALWRDGGQNVRHDEIADTSAKIVTFGEAEDGELYFIHYGNPSTVHRLLRNPHAGRTSPFPRKLGVTGLFADVAKQTPSSGVIPFGVRAPMWSDGAEGSRFIGMVAGEGLSTKVWQNRNGRTDSKVTWPKDAVLAKTISMEMEAGNADSMRKIETQVLHYDGETWNAYSYRWNDSGTDAELVGPGGEERTLELAGSKFPGGRHRHAYRFHSRAECLRCHNSWNGFVLGFQPPQLTEDSAKLVVEAGLVDQNYLGKSAVRLVDPHDDTQPADARARAWLHANCAHCHRENGGGSVPLMLNAEMPLNEMRALDEKPARGEFGMAGCRVIKPDEPLKSALLHRIATTGAGHMPVIGAREVDDKGLKLIADWILTTGNGEGKMLDVPASAPDSADAALNAVLSRDALGAERFAGMVRRAGRSPDAHIRGLFERFLPDELRIETLGASPDVGKITAKKGDARRGAELFSPTGKASTCLACHFINGSGRDFGPDLSSAGKRLTKAQLIESLLAPSKQMVQGFQPVVVTLKDGGAHTGFLLKSDADAVTLKIAAGQTVVLRRGEMKGEQALAVSLMPEGLLQSFTAQEAADLIEYLASLKGREAGN
ncbi:MAG: PQQ-dependent sugar dehydrogenase [Chthoniobacteraceae bacterium]